MTTDEDYSEPTKVKSSTSFTGYTLYERYKSRPKWVAIVDGPGGCGSTLSKSDLVSQAPNESNEAPEWQDFTDDGDAHRAVSYSLFDDVSTFSREKIDMERPEHTSMTLFREFGSNWCPIAFSAHTPVPAGNNQQNVKDLADAAVDSSPPARCMVSVDRDHWSRITGNGGERIDTTTESFGAAQSHYDFLDRWRTKVRNRGFV